MHLWQWGKVKDLARTNVMERLIALAQSHARVGKLVAA
jgi:hypothetical protein